MVRGVHVQVWSCDGQHIELCLCSRCAALLRRVCNCILVLGVIPPSWTRCVPRVVAAAEQLRKHYKIKRATRTKA